MGGGGGGGKQKLIFTPDIFFEARAFSNFELAFHFIFGELSTPSRSKLTADLAKSTKIEVLQGGSNS